MAARVGAGQVRHGSNWTLQAAFGADVDPTLYRERTWPGLGAMKLAEIMREHYDEAVRLGWSDKDWSALGAVIAQEAGIAIAGSDRSA